GCAPTVRGVSPRAHGDAPGSGHGPGLGPPAPSRHDGGRPDRGVDGVLGTGVARWRTGLSVGVRRRRARAGAAGGQRHEPVGHRPLPHARARPAAGHPRKSRRVRDGPPLLTPPHTFTAVRYVARLSHVRATPNTLLPVVVTPEDPQVTTEHITDDFVGDLVVAYSTGGPDVPDLLTWEEFDRLGISRRDLRSQAAANLYAALDRVGFHGQPPALMLSFDGLESSVLLAHRFWDDVERMVPGELVVGVPARDVVIFTGSGSRAGIEKVRRAVDRVLFAGGEHLLSRDLLVRRQRRWEVLTGVPSAVPVHASAPPAPSSPPPASVRPTPPARTPVPSRSAARVRPPAPAQAEPPARFPQPARSAEPERFGPSAPRSRSGLPERFSPPPPSAPPVRPSLPERFAPRPVPPSA